MEEYDAEGKFIPVWNRPKVYTEKVGTGRETHKERNARLGAFEKQMQEEEEHRRYLDSIPVRTVKSITTAAKKQNKWLYDPKDKRWFTPEEYLDLRERFTYGIQPEIDRLEIRDPVERINNGFAYIKEFKEFDRIDLLKEFVIKVVGYYRSK